MLFLAGVSGLTIQNVIIEINVEFASCETEFFRAIWRYFRYQRVFLANFKGNILISNLVWVSFLSLPVFANLLADRVLLITCNYSFSCRLVLPEVNCLDRAICAFAFLLVLKRAERKI